MYEKEQLAFSLWSADDGPKDMVLGNFFKYEFKTEDAFS